MDSGQVVRPRSYRHARARAWEASFVATPGFMREAGAIQVLGRPVRNLSLAHGT